MKVQMSSNGFPEITQHEVISYDSTTKTLSHSHEQIITPYHRIDMHDKGGHTKNEKVKQLSESESKYLEDTIDSAISQVNK